MEPEYGSAANSDYALNSEYGGNSASQLKEDTTEDYEVAPKRERSTLSFQLGAAVVICGVCMSLAGIGMAYFGAYKTYKMRNDFFDAKFVAVSSSFSKGKALAYGSWDEFFVISFGVLACLLAVLYIFKKVNNLFCCTIHAIVAGLSLVFLFIYTNERKSIMCQPTLQFGDTCDDAKVAIVGWSLMLSGSFFVVVGSSPGNARYSSVSSSIGKLSGMSGIIFHIIAANISCIGAFILLAATGKAYQEDKNDGLSNSTLASFYSVPFIVIFIVILTSAWHLFDYISNHILRMTFLALHAANFGYAIGFGTTFSTSYIEMCLMPNVLGSLPVAYSQLSCDMINASLAGAIMIIAGEFGFLVLNAISYFSAAEDQESQEHPFFNSALVQKILVGVGAILSVVGSGFGLFTAAKSYQEYDDNPSNGIGSIIEVVDVSKADLFSFYFFVPIYVIGGAVYSVYMIYFRLAKRQKGLRSSVASSFVYHRLNALLLASIHVIPLMALFLWLKQDVDSCDNYALKVMACEPSRVYGIVGVSLMTVGEYLSLIGGSILPFF
eukprot:Nk52_evm5s377 gene=Nk52_evmTU5s377